MANFINDPHCIGYWALNEPSGAAYFKNYSQSWGSKPSGISFDLHVQQSINQSTAHGRSEWPGQAEFFNSASGTTYRGLQLHGTYQSTLVESKHSKTLSIGRGTYTNRIRTLTPSIAQSGFTFGFWVQPQSNGYQEYVDGTDDGIRQHAWGNALMGRGDDDFGIWMGVSGNLAGGAQFTSTREGGPHLLTGYLYVVGLDTANPFTDGAAEILEAPIEEGAYTHLTGSYRYIDGTVNQVALYRNGRLAASGVTTRDLTLTPDAGSLFDDVRWTIGGAVADNSSAPQDRYPLTAGWNHLVSGAYYFNRVLDEGEVLDMHLQGGMQPELGRQIGESSEITLEDGRILAYYPFSQVGYSDASAHHRPLISAVDEGDNSEFGVFSGPFNRGGWYKLDGGFKLVATSGLTFDLAEASAGFSISLRYLQSATTTYIANMLASIGSTDDILNPVISNSTLGFHISRDSVTTDEKVFVRIFEIGDESTVTILEAQDPVQADQVMSHLVFVYDNASNGVALYLDGEFQSSGTLTNPLGFHLTNLAGSGFPLMFGNGVLDQDPNVTDTAAAANSALSEIGIFNSPLRADEIRWLAYSGINLAPIMRSVDDPRLAGYWPCTDFDGDDTLIEDQARVWSFMPGHANHATNDVIWDQVETTDDQSEWLRTDLFNIASLPPELASFGNLGITSGVFAVYGGSESSLSQSTNTQIKSSIANFALRYKPNTEDQDVACHNFLGEYILGFEVTPSGTIPPSEEQADGTENNSVLIDWSDNVDAFIGYLSTANNHLTGSGIAVVFAGNETATIQPHVSGNIPFGVPSRVALHLRWTNPYESETTGANVVPFVLNLYIDGTKVAEKTDFSNTAKIWSDAVPASTSDNYILQFGGRAVQPNTEVHAAVSQAGLGGNYMRNIFIAKGSFSKDDIEYFATSGVAQTNTLSNYSNPLPTTQFAITNTNLRGFWRFSGQPSGETNLATNGVDLVPLGRDSINSSTNRGSIYNLRYLPGPLANSDLGIQSSGISYLGDTTGFGTGDVAPFIASGTAFQDPENGFSVGFMFNRRAAIGSNDAEILLSYGVVPTSISDATVQDNPGWAILFDEAGSLKMVLSTAGNMFLDGGTSAASAGQVVCGAFQANPPFKVSHYQDFERGAFVPQNLDSWGHVIWTYNATDTKLRCYLNGELVDVQHASSAPFTPTDPTARFISFLLHQEGDVWTYGNTRAAQNIYLTDVFYCDDTLTNEEARYIAFNSIDDAPRVDVSGLIGGFIAGLGEVSGLVGGFTQGLDTVSGIIGSYLAGSIQYSGLIGSFTHGLAVMSGIVGGFVTGNQETSGIIGGYIQSSAQFSGILGSYIIGGLSGLSEFDGNFTVSAIGAKNFDAMLEVRKQTFADFDAAVFVYQDEEPPDVGIIIPGDTVTGLSPTFDQYFIGAASGKQGKTISSTRWNFGDLTGNFTSSVSGSNFYPISHKYTTSGIMIARFTATDSHGIQNSATRIINIASGIPTVEISLSGVPRQGFAELIVDFENKIENSPSDVSIHRRLLDFDDGQTSILTNPSHGYKSPGIMVPLFIVVDSRGFLWSDSLNMGQNN